MRRQDLALVHTHSTLQEKATHPLVYVRKKLQLARLAERTRKHREPASCMQTKVLHMHTTYRHVNAQLQSLVRAQSV